MLEHGPNFLLEHDRVHHYSRLPDRPAYMASADPLIASGHPMSTAMFTGKCFPIKLPNMIKNKQFRFISEKNIKSY